MRSLALALVLSTVALAVATQAATDRHSEHAPSLPWRAKNPTRWGHGVVLRTTFAVGGPKDLLGPAGHQILRADTSPEALRMTVAQAATPKALRMTVVQAGAQDDSHAGVVVTFADGSSLPLTSWSLSYEYQSAASSTFAAARRESRDLLVGKKALPTAGGVLEVQYREYERMSGGAPPQKETVAIATGLVFRIEDKKSTFRIEAPHRDLLVPAGGAKGAAVQARALDLTGLTFTGTKRSFCILAYTAQVECNPPRGDRIVRIEFQR